MLAGLGSGFWVNPQELIKRRKIENIFVPKMSNKIRSKLLTLWNIAIKKTLITSSIKLFSLLIIIPFLLSP